MNDEIQLKENFEIKDNNILNNENEQEINNDINIIDNQKEINPANNRGNLFNNQNPLDKNDEEININTNIINNDYNSNSGININEPNKLNFNYDIASLENQNLKKQIIELMQENQNLQKQINYQDSEYSPYTHFPTEDNNRRTNYINNNNQIYNPNLYSNDRFEQGMKMEYDNDINFNNIMNPSYKNQKYVDDSIESIIKTNMSLSPKKRQKIFIKKPLQEILIIKQYLD